MSPDEFFTEILVEPPEVPLLYPAMCLCYVNYNLHAGRGSPLGRKPPRYQSPRLITLFLYPAMFALCAVTAS